MARRILFAVTLLVAVAAFVAVLAPVVFVCSAHSWLGCQLLDWSLGWAKDAGAWYAANVLCSIGAVQCSGGMEVHHAESAFHALFEFSVAIGLLLYFRDHCREALEKLSKELNELPFETVEMALEKDDPESYRVKVLARERQWRPRYERAVNLTMVLALLCFLLTAIVSGNVLLLPLVAEDAPLQFSSDASILLAHAPFVAILCLFMDLALLRQFVALSLAPEFYWKRSSAARAHQRSMARLSRYLGDVDETGSAFWRSTTERLKRIWRWLHPLPPPSVPPPSPPS